jgi:hypothetical protein
MHGIDRPVCRGRGDICEERRPGNAESNFLAFHVAARLERACRLIDAELGEVRVAGCFGGINDAETHGEQHHHCAEQTPALALVADHAPESMGQCGADQKNQQHFEEICERCWILIGMRRIGIEETAAIAAEELDRFLRCDRPARDDLCRTF